MESLLRTRVGSFTLSECMTLSQAEAAMADGTIPDKICSVEEALKEYPRLVCTPGGDRLLLNGNPIPETLLKCQNKEGWVRMCASSGAFAGIFMWDAKKERYYPVKMF